LGGGEELSSVGKSWELPPKKVCKGGFKLLSTSPKIEGNVSEGNGGAVGEMGNGKFSSGGKTGKGVGRGVYRRGRRGVSSIGGKV
jgi:hypothetical protein